MRGRQSEKTTIKAGERGEETDGEGAEVQGGKENENKSFIIYLEDTSSSTFSSGQWCSAKNKVFYSVGQLFYMI